MEPTLEVASLAQFYFFALLDEELALSATRENYKLLKKNIEPGSQPLTHHQIVSSLARLWPKTLSTRLKSSGPLALTKNFQGKGLDLSIWRQFLAASGEQEQFAVICHQILGWPHSEIARGLGVSEGTVRHRVARGLRTLGQFRFAGRLSGL